MDDSDRERADCHTGYTPEDGVLSRVREWNDVFGWLRLGRVLRLAGSPTALGIVAVTLAVWMLGVDTLEMRVQMPIPPDVHGTERTAGVAILKPVLGTYLVATPPSLLDRESFRNGFWMSLAFVAWSVFMWTPALLFLMRQGALLTAGRNLDDVKPVMRLAIRRAPLGWFVATVPLACGLAIGLLIMLLGLVSRIAMGIEWIEFVFAVAVAIVAVVGGILLFGATFAVPLGWSALVNEEHPDSLDSLSRGFEYVYRRPLQLVMYIAIAIVPLWIVLWLSDGIAMSAIQLSERMLVAADASKEVIAITDGVLRQFPTVVAFTLLVGLIGGVYLLLRSDAGGQEVEDIWIPKPEPKQLLPELPQADER